MGTFSTFSMTVCNSTKYFVVCRTVLCKWRHSYYFSHCVKYEHDQGCSFHYSFKLIWCERSPSSNSSMCPCFLLVLALMLVLTLNKSEWGLIPMKTNSLSETLQADQLCKKAGHTSTNVSLRNRDENLLFLVTT